MGSTAVYLVVLAMLVALVVSLASPSPRSGEDAAGPHGSGDGGGAGDGGG
ncbi:hypothetical protein ABZ234_22905 [Nocardiopsis sp. NPDC006198]